MTRPAIAALFAAAMLPLMLAACATQATSPPVATNRSGASIAIASQPASAAAVRSVPALLPPVPQPPERPVAPPSVTDPALPLPQRIDAFIDFTAQTYRVDRAVIRAALAQAEYKQSIIDAINRPAEKTRTWAEYRPIFMNDARISGGRRFLADNRVALDAVSAKTGVPAEFIVAIIGVETSYGRITGSYRVIDALYTLAFWHPKRAPFFAGELAQAFALAKDEPHLDLMALKGSYAGAMGMGQFMPSSYRNWAKDGDADGIRDLLLDKDDAFASIANYFVVHGWQRGGPVVARAQRDAAAADFAPDSLDPVYPLADLARRGYRPQAGQAIADGATLLSLDGDAGREYWLGYRNFYVVTRYNHSPMYALAVTQLAQAIAGTPAP